LLEVPRQESPSSVTVAGYAEVATAPGVGEFQVDYQFKTGMIRFNAADATDNIQVTYEGTGSPILAADQNRAWNYAGTPGNQNTNTTAYVDDSVCAFNVTVAVPSILLCHYMATSLESGGAGIREFRILVGASPSEDLKVGAAGGWNPSCVAFMLSVAAGVHTIKGQFRLTAAVGSVDVQDRVLTCLALKI